MTPDRTRWCELLVGLERVEVLDVVRRHDHLVVTIQSSERIMGCSACGTRAKVKDRDRVELADLPAFGCHHLVRQVDPSTGETAMAGEELQQ